MSLQLFVTLITKVLINITKTCICYMVKGVKYIRMCSIMSTMSHGIPCHFKFSIGMAKCEIHFQTRRYWTWHGWPFYIRMWRIISTIDCNCNDHLTFCNELANGQLHFQTRCASNTSWSLLYIRIWRLINTFDQSRSHRFTSRTAAANAIFHFWSRRYEGKSPP